jgi:hypothetical protein
MPINKITCTPVIAAALLGKKISGTSSAAFAAAVADGLSTYVNGPLTFQVNAVGTAGAGIGTNAPGTVNVSSALLSSSLASTFAGLGISGSSSPALASALASGISQCFLLAIPQIPVPTVGVGSGIGLCIPTALGPIMVSAFSGAGLTGTSASQLALAIGTGVDAVLATTPVTVVIAGPPSPVPAAGLAIGGRFI